MSSMFSPSYTPSLSQSPLKSKTAAASNAFKMPALSWNFLQILVLLLSMSALEATGPRPVTAAPLRRDSSAGFEGMNMARRDSNAGMAMARRDSTAGIAMSRRGSTASMNMPRRDSQSGGLESLALEQRARKPRIGMNASDKRSFSSSPSFPDINARGSTGHALPLQELENRSKLHPQMLLQHHINRAHAKLETMHGRQAPSREHHQQSLLRRRDAILQDEERKRRRSLADDHAPDDIVDLYPRKQPSGNSGISLNPSTGKAGKAAKVDQVDESERRQIDDRALDVVTATDMHVVVDTVTVADDVASSSSSTEAASSTTSSSAVTAVSARKAKATSSKSHSSSHSSSHASSNHSSATTTSQVSSTSTYDIAKLGFPTAALTASNSSGLEYGDDPTTKGSLALDIEANDIGYIAIFDIGTAGPFRLLIDSGSADTWIASTKCTNCTSTHKMLGSSNSKTYADITPEVDFEITYGTGYVAGHTANDTLHIGTYALKNHTMGLATTESTDFSSDSVPFDGLMGLAQSSLSSTDKPTPIDSLYSSKAVSQPVMGYRLGRSSDTNNDGQVTFGGVDGSMFEGNLTEVNSTSDDGFWQVDLGGVYFNNTQIKLTGSYERSAILDTGTTLIVAPSEDADALHAAIDGAKSDGEGGYTIPCTTSAQVEFEIGGKRWPLDARDMIFLPVDENDLTGDCVSAVSAGTVGSEGEWLIGAAFLKNVYFATNAKTQTIGLGELTANANTTKSYTSDTAKYQDSYE